MTYEEMRELATEIILDYARDIEYLTIEERLPENLSRAQAGHAAGQIAGLIALATISVELPRDGAR
jgi:hypothetical protein